MIAPSMEGLGAGCIVGMVADNQSGRRDADGLLGGPDSQVTAVLVERLASCRSIFFDPKGVATPGTWLGTDSFLEKKGFEDTSTEQEAGIKG